MLSSRIWRPSWPKAVIRPNSHSIFYRHFTVLGIETSCDDTSVCLLSIDYHPETPERTNPESSKPSRIQDTIKSSPPKYIDRRERGKAKHKDPEDIVPKARIDFHETIISDNRIYGGIHPVISLRSHRANLATLVQQCLNSRGFMMPRLIPDLIAVTRGPGMTSSLDVGLETAKGLAVALDRPLVGVNHMQAHALTMRLVNATQTTIHKHFDTVRTFDDHKPKFPFLNLLISGGHTLLVLSTSLTEHRILVDTLNIAIGDAVDKCARSILPRDITSSSQKYVKNAAGTSKSEGKAAEVMPSTSTNNTVAYGRLLESFVFPDANTDYAAEFLKVPGGPSGRSLDGDSRIVLPLTGANDSSHSKLMKFSFSSFPSNVDNVLEKHWGKVLSHDDVVERRKLGLEVMTRMFQHLTDRVMLGIEALTKEGIVVKDLVVAGGVASNGYLRYLLQKSFSTPVATEESRLPSKEATGTRKESTTTTKKGRKPKKPPTLNLHFPPVEFCTDNAAMIAWTGWEMYNAGWETRLDVQPFRKWSLEAKKDETTEQPVKGRKADTTKLDKTPNEQTDAEKKSEDGWGILTVDGWKPREWDAQMKIKTIVHENPNWKEGDLGPQKWTERIHSG